MSPTGRAALHGAAGVVVFDAVAAVASRQFAFPYESAALGSWFVYAAVGFVAVRLGASIGGGVVAGALAGLTDATFGWDVSWAIGPGRTPDGSLTPAIWVVVALSVVAMGAVMACLGATVGALVRRPGAPAA